MKKKITIIGGGSWGTAIAQLLAKNKHQVLIYLRNQKQKDSINNQHLNQKYFPKHRLSIRIKASLDLREAISFASILILAVPTHVTRKVLQEITPLLTNDQIIISTAKGIEEGSHLRNSEIIREFTSLPLAILSGPTHAEEVINDLPTTVVIASSDHALALRIQNLMMSPTFRVYTSLDLIGVEMGGAIKNIIALAAGIVDGLGYGDNTKAALITRGLHEMSRLGVYLGGNILTFAGLTGMGDLVVTCTSMHSRNRRFGIKIGQGMKLKESLNSINQVVEGVKTTKAIYEWSQQTKFDFELPITEQVYQVLFKNKDPLQAINELMLREPKHEMEEVIKNNFY